MSLLGSILHCGMDFTPFVSGFCGRVILDGVGGGLEADGKAFRCEIVAVVVDDGGAAFDE